MKREKNYKTARLIEALEYIDVRFIEEAAEKIKPRPTGQAFYGKPSRSKALRQFLALAACVLLLSAAIPAITYLANHLPDIVAFFIGDETTGTDPELTHPETPPTETSRAPETTVNTDPETTAPLYDGTTAEPEPEHNGSYGLEYKMNEDGKSAMLFHRGICTDENVIVASVWNGVPVTIIGEAAFADYIKYKTITIPESVTVIDMRAFKNCTGLESVVLHDGISYIGADAFENCVALTEITLPKSLEWIQTGLFMNCINLQKVIIGNEVERIVFGAFYDCSALRELHYLGTKAEWNAIQKDETWNTKSAITVVHCSDGDVEITPYNADEPEYDGSRGLEYKVNNDGKTASLFGIGTCTDTDIVVASTYNGLPVTEIFYNAFNDNSQIVSVIIPESVTFIDKRAFANCISLESITLPSGLKNFGDAETFKNCTSLKTIVLPDGMKYLGVETFKGCTSLESIVMKGVGSIDISAFEDCAKLNNIVISGKCIDISDSAFKNCSSLTNFSFDGTVNEWLKLAKGNEWSEGCPFTVIHCSDGDVDLIEYDGSRGLEYRIEGDHAVLVGIGTCTDKEIIVASTYNGLPVTAIGRKAIYSLDGITRVVISDTVTHLDYMAIAWCSDLESIHISANLTTMEEYAIIAFGNIRSITVDPNNPNYYSVNNCLINRETKALILGCDTSIIPTDGSISAIAPKAFMMCDGIESITIPEGVTKIGEDAFYDCSALKSIELPESLITIDSSAFANCSSLQNVKLGGKVEYMGDYVFSECVKLGEIILPDSLSFLGNYAFQGCTDLKRAVLSSNLEILELMIFASCTNLGDVIIPEGVKTISTDAFSNTALKELKLPASIKVIRHGAFEYCDNLMNVSYAGTVTQWIAVEKDISWHTVGTFKKIRCSDGEMKLYSDSKNEGSLGLEYEINTDGKSARLIGEGICTDAKIVVAAKFHGLPVTEIYSVALSNCDFIEEIVIPEGVTVIRNQAFYRCVNLKKITLPSTLEYIYDSAFADCESLVSIVIPREVKLIETWAFRDCKNLTKFTFAGTVAEWNAIQKGMGNNWNEDCPFTVIHCSDGDVLAEPITYDEATELARQYWSPIESGYFVCYASYEMYLLVRPDEVIVDRIYIDRYTGEISQPKLTYPDIPDPLLKVLLNETTYIRQFDSGSEGYFKDTILDYPTAETGSFGYAVCDLDGDGKEELILSSIQYEIVLREFEGKVYGYLFNFRSLLDLKTDGSFNFTSNAGMTYGTARLSFDGTKYVFTELTRRENADDGSISYFVDDKKVTKEEFDAREELLSQEEAPYEHLAIYPLRAWFPGG